MDQNTFSTSVGSDTSRSTPLQSLYEAGRPHEVDGFYGISMRIAPLVLEAMRTDSSLSDFKALDARFNRALFRFDPSNANQVSNLATYFPGASVLLVTRGNVDRVMSMSTYRHTVNTVPVESNDPIGC